MLNPIQCAGVVVIGFFVNQSHDRSWQNHCQVKFCGHPHVYKNQCTMRIAEDLLVIIMSSKAKKSYFTFKLVLAVNSKGL